MRIFRVAALPVPLYGIRYRRGVMLRRRRFFQISLRSFLLLVAGVAVLTNWTIDHVRLHARQLEVAAQLANRGIDDLASRLPRNSSYRGPRGHFVNISVATGWSRCFPRLE
jgi:hypothetical protein